MAQTETDREVAEAGEFRMKFQQAESVLEKALKAQALGTDLLTPLRDKAAQAEVDKTTAFSAVGQEQAHHAALQAQLESNQSTEKTLQEKISEAQTALEIADKSLSEIHESVVQTEAQTRIPQDQIHTETEELRDSNDLVIAYAQKLIDAKTEVVAAWKERQETVQGILETTNIQLEKLTQAIASGEGSAEEQLEYQRTLVKVEERIAEHQKILADCKDAVAVNQAGLENAQNQLTTALTLELAEGWNLKEGSERTSRLSGDESVTLGSFTQALAGAQTHLRKQLETLENLRTQRDETLLQADKLKQNEAALQAEVTSGQGLLDAEILELNTTQNHSQILSEQLKASEAKIEALQTVYDAKVLQGEQDVQAYEAAEKAADLSGQAVAKAEADLNAAQDRLSQEVVEAAEARLALEQQTKDTQAAWDVVSTAQDALETQRQNAQPLIVELERIEANIAGVQAELTQQNEIITAKGQELKALAEIETQESGEAQKAQAEMQSFRQIFEREEGEVNALKASLNAFQSEALKVQTTLKEAEKTLPRQQLETAKVINEASAAQLSYNQLSLSQESASEALITAQHTTELRLQEKIQTQTALSNAEEVLKNASDALAQQQAATDSTEATLMDKEEIWLRAQVTEERLAEAIDAAEKTLVDLEAALTQTQTDLAEANTALENLPEASSWAPEGWSAEQIRWLKDILEAELAHENLDQLTLDRDAKIATANDAQTALALLVDQAEQERLQADHAQLDLSQTKEDLRDAEQALEKSETELPAQERITLQQREEAETAQKELAVFEELFGTYQSKHTQEEAALSAYQSQEPITALEVEEAQAARAALNEIKARLDLAETSLEDLLAEAENLRSQIAENQTNLQPIQTEYASETKQLDALLAAIGTLVEEVQTKKDLYGKEQNDYQALADEFSEQSELLNKNLTLMNSQKTVVEDSTNALHVAQNEEDTQALVVAKERAEAQEVLAILERAEVLVSEKLSLLAASMERLKALENEVDAQEEVRAQAESDLVTRESLLEEAYQTRDAAQAELDELEYIAKAAKEQSDISTLQLESAKDALQEEENEVLEAQAVLEAHTSQVEDAEEVIENAEEVLGALSTQVENAKDLFEETQTHFQEVEAEMDDWLVGVDTITVRNWFDGQAHQVERISFGDGRILDVEAIYSWVETGQLPLESSESDPSNLYEPVGLSLDGELSEFLKSFDTRYAHLLKSLSGYFPEISNPEKAYQLLKERNLWEEVVSRYENFLEEEGEIQGTFDLDHLDLSDFFQQNSDVLNAKSLETIESGAGLSERGNEFAENPFGEEGETGVPEPGQLEEERVVQDTEINVETDAEREAYALTQNRDLELASKEKAYKRVMGMMLGEFEKAVETALKARDAGTAGEVEVGEDPFQPEWLALYEKGGGLKLVLDNQEVEKILASPTNLRRYGDEEVVVEDFGQDGKGSFDEILFGENGEVSRFKFKDLEAKNLELDLNDKTATSPIQQYESLMSAITGFQNDLKTTVNEAGQNQVAVVNPYADSLEGSNSPLMRDDRGRELLKAEQFEDISNWNAQKYSTHTPVVTGSLDISRTVTAGFARAGGSVTLPELLEFLNRYEQLEVLIEETEKLKAELPEVEGPTEEEVEALQQQLGFQEHDFTETESVADELDQYISHQGGDDFTDGGRGDDFIGAGEGDDMLLGGAGNDELVGLQGEDQLYGESGDDRLHGGSDDDELYGGRGNDLLQGSTGDDLISGGTGDDVLDGGSGDEVYLFNRGDGNDIIHDLDSIAGNVDTLRFGAGINPENVEFERDGFDLIARIKALEEGVPDDSIRVNDWFKGELYSLENWEFSDQQKLTSNQITDRFIRIEGTVDSDYHRRDKHGELLVINGVELFVGQGDLIGTYRADQMFGNEGNDVLFGKAGDDYLHGGEGTDDLDGSSGDDTLIGGKGDDTLRGGRGSDVYQFNLGDGQDLILNEDNSSGQDELRFGDQISRSDLLFRRSGWDLIIRIQNSQDQVVVQEWYKPDIYGVKRSRLDHLSFSDNTTLSQAEIEASARVIQGSDQAELLRGYEEDDTLIGGQGNDYLSGGEGADTYHFKAGDGRNTIYDVEGRDQVVFGAGFSADKIKFRKNGDHLIIEFEGLDDKLAISQWFNDPENEIEKFVFNDGSSISARVINEQLLERVVIRGADHDEALYYTNEVAKDISAGQGDDIVEAGGGSNRVDGGEGDDVILSGSHDVIPDGSSEYLWAPKYQVVDGADHLMGGQGDDTLFGAGGKDILEGGAGDDLLEGSRGNDDLLGGEGADHLLGGSGEDVLEGGADDDVLEGGSGADVLIGGQGTDTLKGGSGDDIYLFNRGDGTDFIEDVYGKDTLQLGLGIKQEALQFLRYKNHLVLQISGLEGETENGQDQLIIRDWFVTEDAQLEQAILADGTVIDLRAVNVGMLGELLVPDSQHERWEGTEGADQYNGGVGADLLFGGEGDDILEGGSGKDQLYGGSGNDQLSGGSGSDALYGGSGDDHLAGGSGADSLYGETGNDRLFGGSGSDYLAGGEGSDQLEGGSGHDVLSGDSGDDTLLGGQDQDQLDGGSGNDILRGEEGNDLLLGGEGNDLLDGGAGNDILSGGLGEDVYLFGRGSGQDVVRNLDASAFDTVSFKAGIDADHLVFLRQGQHLIIQLIGSDDRITLEGWFEQPYFRPEILQFADGSTLDPNQTPVLTLSVKDSSAFDYQLENGHLLIQEKIQANPPAAFVQHTMILRDWLQRDLYLGSVRQWEDLPENDTDFSISLQPFLIPEFNAAGDSTYMGNAQDEEVHGLDGADQLYGGGGQDQLFGGEGDDVLSGDLGNDELEGGSGHDILSGGEGNDILDGGQGHDLIQGGKGADVFIYRQGDGLDFLAEVPDQEGERDTLKFSENISLTDLTFRRVTERVQEVKLLEDPPDIELHQFDKFHLQIAIGDQGDQIVVHNWWAPTGDVWGEHTQAEAGTIEQLQLYGHEPMTLRDLLQDLKVIGTQDDNVILGSDLNERFYGKEGNDILAGGSGDDVYFFNQGDGQDLIIEKSDEGVDTLKLGPGITASRLVFSRVNDGQDLLINVQDSADQITIQGWFSENKPPLERIELEDSSILNFETIAEQSLEGTEGEESGSEEEEEGNELPSEEEESDVYIFEAGAGQKVVIETGDNKKAIELKGISPEQVKLQRVVNDLVIHAGNSGDQITLKGWLAQKEARVEELRFDNGVIWKEGQLIGDSIEIHGSSGDDQIYGSDQADHLFGGTGDDQLRGGDGDDVYLFNRGDGKDVLLDTQGHETLRFGVGIHPEEVAITREGNNLILRLEETDDQVILINGLSNFEETRVEWIAFENGTIWNHADLAERTWNLEGTEDADVLMGSDAKDHITGKFGSDVLVGQGGNDFLDGGGSSDMLDGGSGNDVLLGGEGSDHLEGGSGHDQIFGGAGADRIFGGEGDDQLEGGSGKDTYYLNRGEGNDTIIEVPTDLKNTLYFGDLILSSQLQFQRLGDDLKIEVIETLHPNSQWEMLPPASVTIKNWYAWSHPFEVIQFAFTYSAIEKEASILQTSGIDTNVNRAVEDAGLEDAFAAIKDAIAIAGTVDLLQGDEKNNVITGTDHDDQILGYEGQDTLDGQAGNDRLYGGSGDDTLLGGEGDDILQGDSGEDRLEGGTGSDTYVFQRGMGQDTLLESEDSNAIDRIEFKGIGFDELQLIRSDKDLIIQLKGTADQVRLLKYYENAQYRVEELLFPGGEVRTLEAIDHADISGTVEGFDGDDLLLGSAQDEVLSGGQGNDVLRGYEGSDTYLFNRGDGQDRIINDMANPLKQDVIQFGKGLRYEDLKFRRRIDDLIIEFENSDDQLLIENHFAGASYKIDQLIFDEGKTMVHSEDFPKDILVEGDVGDEALQGTSGNERFIGYEGNDRLSGGTGNDTYVFRRGDGQDTISENSGFDTLELQGIAPEELEFVQIQNTLEIRVKNTEDKIIITNWGNNPLFQLEQLVFTDSNSVWDTQKIVEEIRFESTDVDDLMTGNIADNVLSGGLGNDTLQGLEGEDSLEGEQGKDILEGGAGTDTYVFNPGDGQDLIKDAEGATLLKFGEGISVDQIDFVYKRDDLILRFKDAEGNLSNDQITIEKGRTQSNKSLLQLVFNDNSILDAEDIEDHVVFEGDWYGDEIQGRERDDEIRSFENNDSVYAGGGNDFVDGGADNDYLDGGEGDDTLVGGQGQDTLVGGEGSDVYRFNRNDGKDTIIELSGNDQLQFGSGIQPDELQMERSGNDVIIRIRETEDQVTLKKFNQDDTAKIELISFADHTVQWGVQDILKQSFHTYGNDESNSLQGSDLADHLQGLGGNDTLDGGVGDDLLEGGGGNDTLDGGVGDNSLEGGEGADILYGGEGSDTYIFNRGDGQDVILDSEQNNTLTFGKEITPEQIEYVLIGRDLLLRVKGTQGEETTDQITIISWRNNITGLPPLSSIVFDNGTSVIPSEIESMLIFEGTAQDDMIQGTEYDNVMYGKEGKDYFEGGSGADHLEGQAGDDRLYGQSGSDTLVGGQGDDSLLGGEGEDVYLFNRGDGDDTIYEESGEDTVTFTDSLNPEEVLVQREGNDLVLKIKGTEDRIVLGGWITEELRRVENVTFSDGTRWDVNDLISKSIAIAGTENDDYLTGTLLSDQLHGHDGQDTLEGGKGDDLLEGGKGNDVLQGGEGADIYQFSRGDGHDTLSDQEGSNVLVLGADINQDQLFFVKRGDDLHIYIKNSDGLLSSDQITLPQWFIEEQHSLSQIQLQDGTVLETSTLQPHLIEGTAENDILQGESQDDFIKGMEGDDTISGGSGNDRLEGDSGQDLMSGGEGDDFLTGGLGNDQLEGGSGADTYTIKLGDGHDIISDSEGNNILQFGPGILPEDLKYDRVQQDLLIQVNGSETQVIIKNVFESQGSMLSQINFKDAPDQSIQQEALTEIITRLSTLMEGDAEDDTIVGTSSSDILSGVGGNDTLKGGAGDDTLIGGTGQDQLMGEEGNNVYVFNRGDGQDTVILEAQYSLDDPTRDLIQFGDDINQDDLTMTQRGPDLVISINESEDQITIKDWVTHSKKIDIKFQDGTVVSQESYTPLVSLVIGDTDDFINGDSEANELSGLGGSDTITGAEGDDLLNGDAGDDVLSGGEGDDTLIGGEGNDLLEGNDGSDVYVFKRGDGQDTIQAEPNDKLNFDAVNFSEVEFLVKADDLLIRFKETADQVILSDWFKHDSNRLSQVVFSDQTLTPEQMEQHLLWEGTDGDDDLSWGVLNPIQIYGSGGNDTIKGGFSDDHLQGDSGDDVIDGGEGNDILVGGTGNDQLHGNEGRDTYIFNRGDGQDTLELDLFKIFKSSNQYNVNTPEDTLHFGEEIAPEDLEFVQIGNDLIIKISGTTDQLTLLNWNEDSRAQLKQITFHSSTQVLSTEDIMAQIIFEATDNDDTLLGNLFDNVISGFDGNDTIEGNGGDDLLTGGKGNDTLTGGDGQDTYIFNRGDGQDRIELYSSDRTKKDSIKFGEGISPDSLEFEQKGRDIIIRLKDSSDQITLVSGVVYTSAHLAKLEFSDGTELNPEMIFENTSIYSSDESEEIYGTALSEEISGLGGDDEIFGLAGNDTLIGGKGNDVLYGMLGNDVYRFNRGDGQDSIYDFEGQCTLQFGEGITYDDLIWIKKPGYSLLRIKDSSDQIGWVNLARIKFADGTEFTVDEIDPQWIFEATESSDDMIGNAEANELDGLGGNDTLAGMAGDDTLTGGSGNDLLVGNSGSDTYHFNLGDGQDIIQDFDGEQDVLQFGEGITETNLEIKMEGEDLLLQIKDSTDRILVRGGNAIQFPIEQIRFKDGSSVSQESINAIFCQSQQIEGTDESEYLEGGRGNDTIRGGKGDDRISGGKGNDTYLYNSGDGSDTITDSGGSADVFKLGAGINADDLSFAQQGEHLVLSIAESQDQVVFYNWFQSKQNQIEQILLNDGTPVDMQSIREIENQHIVGSDSSDSLKSGVGDDILEGGEGEDDLYGGEGQDTLIGGEGGDMYFIDPEGGHHTIIETGISIQTVTRSGTIPFGNTLCFMFKDSNNSSDYEKIPLTPDDLSLIRNENDLVITITNHSGGATIKNWFQENPPVFNIIIAQNIFNGQTIAYEEIQEWLNPGEVIEDNPTYSLDREQGEQTYKNFHKLSTDGSVNLGEGIGPDDLILERHGKDLVLKIKDTTDQITFTLWGASASFQVSAFIFNDGTRWNNETINNHITLYEGTAQDDFLEGHDEADLISGSEGNDFILGRQGDDVLNGGLGDDTYIDEEGEDTYLFNRGDGKDTINLYDLNYETNQLKFGSDISKTDIEYIQKDKNLILQIRGTEDQVTLRSWFNDKNSMDLVFSDNTLIPADQIETEINIQKAKWLEDHSTTIARKEGTEDDDNFVFNKGAGKYTIYEYGGNDTLRFGEGISSDDLDIRIEEKNLVIHRIGTNDMVIINDWVLSRTNHIEQILLNDGSALDLSPVIEQLDTHITAEQLDRQGMLSGTFLNDLIEGDDNTNIISGGYGDDILMGGEGGDVYMIAPGGGHHTIIDTGTDTTNPFLSEFGIEGTGHIVYFAEREYAAQRSDLSFSREGQDLVVTMRQGGGVTIKNWYTGELPAYYFMTFSEEREPEIMGASEVESFVIQNIRPNAAKAAPETFLIHSDSGETTDSTEIDQETGSTEAKPNTTDETSAETSNAHLVDKAGDQIYYFHKTPSDEFPFTIEQISLTETHPLYAQISALQGDVLLFGDGITPADLQVRREGDLLKLGFIGQEDGLEIADWFSQTERPIPNLVFAQELLTAEEFEDYFTDSLIPTEYLTEMDDGVEEVLIDTNSDTPSDTDDTEPESESEADPVNDLYEFHRGAGELVIEEYEGKDVIHFGSQISPEDLRISKMAQDMIMQIEGSQDSIRVKDAFSAPSHQIEKLVFEKDTDGEGESDRQTEVPIDADQMAAFDKMLKAIDQWDAEREGNGIFCPIYDNQARPVVVLQIAPEDPLKSR
ncbi:calcium-binding protein [Deltaproteobacteria bacterium TL4]